MKIFKGTKTILNLMLLGTAVLSFAVIPNLALAGTDGDGFSATEEDEIGIFLPASMKPSWSGATTRAYYDCPDPRFSCAADLTPETRYYFPPCDGVIPREECVTDNPGDPNVPSMDAFIVFVRGNGCPAAADIACGEPCPEPLFDTDGDGIKNSNYPKYDDYDTYFDPLKAAKSSLADGGLFISVKEILWVTPPTVVEKTDLKIGETQYAILFTEKMNPCISVFGSSVPGVPTEQNSGFPKVNTSYIRNWIWDHCTRVTIVNRKGVEQGPYDVEKCIDNLSYDMEEIILTHPLGTENDTRELLRPLDYNLIANSSFHELTHAWDSARGKGTTFFHYKIGQGWVLDQFLYTKITVGKQSGMATTIIEVSEEHAGQTQESIRMK